MGEKFKYIRERAGGSNMNVLMISLDSTLAMDKNKIIGDSQDRHILYGKYLSNLFIIVPSPKGVKLGIKKLSVNVTVYPTPSHGLRFVWDAYKIGRRICKENKIDVITTQDPLLTGLVGYLLKRKFNIPFNVQLHGNYLDNEFWLKNSKLFHVWNMIGKFVVKGADCVRVVSSIIRDTLINKLGISSEKVITFPVFTDVSKFENSGLKDNLKEKYRDFENIVLFVGALIKRKNIESLLSAAPDVINKYPKTLVLIIGEGEEKVQLSKLSTKLGIEQNIRFEGKVTQEELPSYYQACSLFVLPSKEDGWGRVVIEALACGKPVIVSDACGVSDVVTNAECGFVFPIDRADILAEKIIYPLEHPELSKKMGERGRRYVIETLDIKKNAYKYREVYERTIELAKRKRI